ncbi:MAG: DsrE family protein [Anaerolineales bacterium]|nr:DsrE family protein [Anaerolineales bacterium]
MAEKRTNLKDSVILITRKGMGSADLDLQERLLKSYLTLVEDANLLPAALCFYGDGVNLVVKGSGVIPQLTALEEQGVYLLVCGTCIEHYGLADQVEVGIVGGMTDILEAQLRADKVITI